MATEISEETKKEIRKQSNGALALIVLEELMTTSEMLAGGKGQFAYNLLREKTGWKQIRD